ncbi:AtpZ/AtpI family protein [Nocardioides daeguensis]|uniref:AtpZ/AtpI family protein n=1 Tax=Nocardioides daeguensis TaxID=908359 RepID=A0ABP6UVM3_9ACTN|nr:AtpZ/AtpI family protein [Nocardioides daeguensis]MBV6725858.1 AtpZ/AtpI family protein [Nocardioides daeguensis]MCR1772627.1 AtpZ/AtpI family protein [Nocardioides daeguensis]
MSQPEEKPQGDPWHAFGYVVAGVAFYGFLGWLADRWLGTTFLVAVGILAGAALGIFMTARRFRMTPVAPPDPPAPPDSPKSDSSDEQ